MYNTDDTYKLHVPKLEDQPPSDRTFIMNVINRQTRETQKIDLRPKDFIHVLHQRQQFQVEGITFKLDKRTTYQTIALIIAQQRGNMELSFPMAQVYRRLLQENL